MYVCTYILSRVLVTETGFGFVIGFINRVTVRNYKQLLITLPVIQFTIIYYWLQLIQRCRCFNTLSFTVTNTSRILATVTTHSKYRTEIKSSNHAWTLLNWINFSLSLSLSVNSWNWTVLKLYRNWRDIASGRTTQKTPLLTVFPLLC
jgi:hypothetical protein